MTDVAIESFWDLAYRNGDHLRHWESPHPPQELAAMVAAGIVPPGATVLDVGCGAGAEAVSIARARAAEAGVEVDFRCADAVELPLAGGSIDFAIDRGCCHVIGREQRGDYARELHRVLRPGAPFLLRGAAAGDEEEGLIAVDAAEIDRAFVRHGFSRGPVVPLAMVAESGTLAANLVVLRRNP